MKLLVAPWGNPSGWKEVTYVFDEKEIKSKTSLRILQEVIKPDNTIIIGLDTLADDGENYEEVKINAEEKIREYADKFGLNGYDVLIAPGIGTFPNGIFQGNALDYYYYIFAKIILNLLENPENILNIYLDLTHGINYITILTYRAIREIAEVFSIFKEVRFRAYNADPSLPAIVDKLSINIIEDSSPIPMPFVEKISQGRPLEPINLSPEERRELFESELKSVREIDNSELSAFIGALYNGLPLALFSFYPDKDKLKGIIFATLNSYEKYIEARKQDRLKVTRRVKIGRDFKTYVFTYAVATLLEESKLVSSKKKEVTIDEIKDLKENLFKFDKRFKVKIDKDIHTLREDLEKEEIGNWQIYNAILGKSIGEPDERNFLAHSGFERNVIEVKKENGKLLLRYRRDKIRIVKDLCQRGLR